MEYIHLSQLVPGEHQSDLQEANPCIFEKIGHGEDCNPLSSSKRGLWHFSVHSHSSSVSLRHAGMQRSKIQGSLAQATCALQMFEPGLERK